MLRLRNRNVEALTLSLPLLVFYLGYFLNHGSEWIPTGFIQYDNVSYAAFARQYIDEPFQLFYANPLNESHSHPAIYFQLQNFVLALLMWLGIGPGLSIVLFSIFFFWASIRTLIALFDAVFPAARWRRLTLWLLCWGGGLIVVCSALVLPLRPQPSLTILDRLFYLDPAWGWWGLNIGRGMIPGLESFYHFLFLQVILASVRRKWLPALFMAFLLSLSHPFTGIQLLLIVLGWSITECMLLRNHSIPFYFPVGLAAITAIHLWYYMLWLPSFIEHKVVSEQYALDWGYRFYHFIPAYILVFALFIVSVYRLQAKIFFSNPNNRLWIAMALVSLVLANHELLIKPMQPIHFTRGYEWLAYFLLGVPAIGKLLEKWKSKKVLIVLFCSVILLDNFLWIINNVVSAPKEASTSYISREQETILNIIATQATSETLIAGSDEKVPYLATARSKAYAWYTHPFTTPNAATKAAQYKLFLQQNVVPATWKNRDMMLLIDQRNPLERAWFQQWGRGFNREFESGNYLLLRTRY